MNENNTLYPIHLIYDLSSYLENNAFLVIKNILVNFLAGFARGHAYHICHWFEMLLFL